MVRPWHIAALMLLLGLPEEVGNRWVAPPLPPLEPVRILIRSGPGVEKPKKVKVIRRKAWMKKRRDRVVR